MKQILLIVGIKMIEILSPQSWCVFFKSIVHYHPNISNTSDYYTECALLVLATHLKQ